MTQKLDGGFATTENRKRLVWLSVFTFFLFGLLIIQFYKIQIVEGEKWTKKAKAQHQLVIIDPFKRGLFYSNTSLKEGHPEGLYPFVTDVPKFHLYVDPNSIPEPLKHTISKKLSVFLSLKEGDQVKLEQQLHKKSRSRKLIMWISRQTRNSIESWWMSYASSHKIPRNAIYFVQDYKRSYPYGKMLGQILHTVREDKDPKTHQQIPTGGLELTLNSYLKGKEGKRVLLRSPRQPLDAGKIVAMPEDGADVYLTVNHYIQAIAEEEIAKAVKTANATAGWAIMMDPTSGEILAWAQYPFFEPGLYKTYFNDAKQKEWTKVKAITDPFEPGSTMKPITLAVCLKANEELKKRGEAPLFSPEEKVPTSSGHFPGRSSPIRDTHSHRYLNMKMALTKSSNIYMARMVQRVIDRLGDKWYRDTLHDVFGFGVKTGIELPSESPGLLPTPGKLHPNGALEWSTPTPFSLAFGHNLLVSSLQMLRSYAILCNGGMDVKPTLIRKIVRKMPEGKEEVVIDNTKKELSPKRLLEPLISQQVVTAMKYVTKPGGSARRGDIFGYTEGGKTATSEKIVNGTYSRKDHISTFIGFAPAKNPRFVLLIAIDEPEYKYIPGVGKNQMGGTCAAPAFAEIGSRALQYLGVEPDDPYGYPSGDPRRNPEKADWVKEAERLQQQYLEWNH